MGTRTLTLVWADDLVTAVCDALLLLGDGSFSGDIARAAERRHDDVAGVLESLHRDGYTSCSTNDHADGAEHDRRWSFTAAGRRMMLNELGAARARVAALEAEIAAPVTLAPVPPLPSEWPDSDAKWVWQEGDTEQAPWVYSANLVIGGAEHRLAVTADEDGGFAASIDGTLVLLVQPAPADPPPRLTLARRLHARWSRRHRSSRIFIG